MQTVRFGGDVLDGAVRPLPLIVEPGPLQESQQQRPRESQQQAAHFGLSDSGKVGSVGQFKF